jgi:hypothetical protein
MHPDKVKQQFIASRTSKKNKDKKNPGVTVNKRPSQAEVAKAVQEASDRFARLGLVQKLLKGEGRERYDHFLSHGFPVWKGTGYYYARFRPGLGSVLFGLFIAVGGLGHWFALWLSWRRQREFVGRYISFARQAAWGLSGVPAWDVNPVRAQAAEDSDEPNVQVMNRKARRMQDKESSKSASKASKTRKGLKAQGSPDSTPGANTPTGAAGPKKRVLAENGKVLVVDAAGDVFLEQEDDNGERQEYLLDPEELVRPSWKDTAAVRFPVWVVRSVGRKAGLVKDQVVEEVEEVEGEVQEVVEATARENGVRAKGRRGGKR